MSVEQLRLKNFQCHEKVSVKLDPEITTIMGPSDSGKSALLRSLRWLALNRPRGDGFVRHGTKEAAVRIRVDGKTVERRKGTANLYKAGKEIYRAFASDVPEPVENLLGLREVNFAGQHDPPFWFNLTAGEVAKELNRIVDLELIDKVNGELASRLRKVKSKQEVVEERLWEAKGRVAELGWVAEADKALREVERLEAEWTGLANRLDGLRGLLAEIELVGEQAKQPLPHLCGLEALKDRWGSKGEKLEQLQRLVVEVEQAETLVGKLCNRLEAEMERLGEEMGGVCPVCGREWEG